jgi:hypothetical protein
MPVNIVVATMAADPAVTLEPRDHLGPVGFRLWHCDCSMRKYMRIEHACQLTGALTGALHPEWNYTISPRLPDDST